MRSGRVNVRSLNHANDISMIRAPKLALTEEIGASEVKVYSMERLSSPSTQQTHPSNETITNWSIRIRQYFIKVKENTTAHYMFLASTVQQKPKKRKIKRTS